MKFISLHQKNKRLNVIDLKNNNPEEFGRFVMALKHLEESNDWYRICGIHGNTFKPDDPGVLCPTDPKIVAIVSETGEPVYCKHSVPSFIAWHVPYIYQFELLLNKYNHSHNKNYIALPYLDLTNFNSDFSFLNDQKITITYDDKKMITNLTCITCNEMCDMCDMFQMNDTLTGIDNVTFYYGVDNKHIDITSIVFTKCITNHKIVIPSGDDCRAFIFGDPIFGIVKYIYMIVNNYKYCKIAYDCYSCIDMVNKKYL